MTTDEQLAVSISKAAKLLDCSPATVRRAIERGELRAVRLMGKLIVPVVELERYLGIERPKPSPEALVDAFAKLVGLADPS
jgi:excisionase family DNA binding protein